MHKLNLNENLDAKINIGNEKKKKFSSGNNNNNRNRFDIWTSGDLEIDKLIRYTQVNSTYHDFWEWIDWDDIDLVEYHGRGFFGEIYSALWISGPLTMWDRELECYNRNGPIKVALKRIENSKKLSQEFINKLYEFYRCIKNNSIVDFFGITRDNTSNYCLVLKYYEDENIYKFLDESKGLLCWRDIVEILWLIASGLKCIHREKLCHGNLHCGNILIDNRDDLLDVRITDVDICDNPNPSETSRQFDDAEDKKFMELETNDFSQPTIHPQAIYSSRPLDFPGIRST
ncbi:9478_t:CDS:2 [Entrophospora sp. SA101]|nr:9473_t:CDS:2 [Entrophospora sp. SA101]CAJ0835081.1 9478_t:CDS:2 [Entrophospora sp. SA101]